MASFPPARPGGLLRLAWCLFSLPFLPISCSSCAVSADGYSVCWSSVAEAEVSRFGSNLTKKLESIGPLLSSPNCPQLFYARHLSPQNTRWLSHTLLTYFMFFMGSRTCSGFTRHLASSSFNSHLSWLLCTLHSDLTNLTTCSFSCTPISTTISQVSIWPLVITYYISFSMFNSLMKYEYILA